MKNVCEPAEALNSTIREYRALCDPSSSQLGLFDGDASLTKAPWCYAACSTCMEMYMNSVYEMYRKYVHSAN